MEKDRARFLSGASFMVFSGFALSLLILFSRLALDFFSLLSLTLLRFLIPAIFLFAWLLWKEKRRAFSFLLIRKKDGGKVLRAFLVVAAQLSILYYLTIGSLLDATVLLNTGPLFIPILEWLFLRHQIGKSTIVAMIVSALGVALILHPTYSLFQTASLIGLFAGVCQAGSQILFGLYAKEEIGLSSLFQLCFICFLLTLIPFLFFFPSERSLINVPEKGWIFILLISFFYVFNQYFRSRAYFFGKPSTLACFFYTSIIFSMFFDWTVFRHVPDILSYIGAALVILGGILKIYLRHIILKKRGL